ncbi:unnamed protein product [Arabidopsis halleri]
MDILDMFSKEKVSLLLPKSVIALTVSLSNSLLQIPPKKFRDSIINDRTTSYIISLARSRNQYSLIRVS